MKKIKVLLADDQPIVRAGLRALLEAAGDMRVVGEAENGQQAVRQTGRLQPEVVVLDLDMPVLNGVEAARQIAHEAPAAKVVIFSSYSDAQHLRQAVEAGVVGYLMKESAGEKLLEAVREARNGRVSYSTPLFKSLLEEWRAGPPAGHSAATRAANLSWRQAEVLQLIAEGNASEQVAGLLSISIKTVETHRQQLMNKLNRHSTATLTRYAFATGVAELNPMPHRKDHANREAVTARC